MLTLSTTTNRFSASEVWDKFGVMPPEAFILGVATDGLPYLLNLKDTVTRNILIKGTSFDFNSLIYLNKVTYRNPVYVVDLPSGTYSSESHESQKLYAVSRWLEVAFKKNNRERIVVIIEDLDSVLKGSSMSVSDLMYLLTRANGRFGEIPVKVIALSNGRIDDRMSQLFDAQIEQGDNSLYTFEEGWERKVYSFYVPSSYI